MANPNDHVRMFVLTVIDAAMHDAAKGVPAYAPENRGDLLLKRLKLNRFRSAPRAGDAKYARSIYTAAHWLYETEQPVPEIEGGK